MKKVILKMKEGFLKRVMVHILISFLSLSLPFYYFSPVRCLLSNGANLAYSQNLNPPITISSTYNPVGSGTRALGYGGTFIAIADDATAASWNPAGLVQLKTPEVSGVGSLFMRMEDFDSNRELSFGGLDDADAIDLNYLSAAYPFNLFNRNMVVSINYFQQFEFERRLKFLDVFRATTITGTSIELTRAASFKQRGELNTLSPAYAIQITPWLSLGIAWNIIPLRFGLFTDPVPSQENPETFFGFAIGSGISLGPLILDFAYQFRTRGNVGGDTLGMPGSSAGISQHNLLFSAIFHF